MNRPARPKALDAARAWGAEGGKIGGKSRMSKLTRDERRALAKKAAAARWKESEHNNPLELLFDGHPIAARHYYIRDQGLADRVAHAVLANFPYAYCFRCLASQLGLSEREVREAALFVVVRDGVGLDRRVCPACGRIDTLLVSGKSRA